MDDASLVVESAHNVKKEKSNIKDELNTESVKLLVFLANVIDNSYSLIMWRSFKISTHAVFEMQLKVFWLKLREHAFLDLSYIR